MRTNLFLTAAFATVLATALHGPAAGQARAARATTALAPRSQLPANVRSAPYQRTDPNSRIDGAL